MAVVMLMEWPGVTPEQYEEARRRVGWETDAPPGGIFHVARFEDGVLHVVDVWETAEDFDRFARERLMPVVKGELQLEGEPSVRFVDAHARFNPAAGVPA